MSGFFRPEAIALLARWREAGIGAAVALAGVWGAATQSGITFYLALLALPAGLALLREGVQRARLPGGGAGPGLVEVDERQITYFGPDGGMAVSVDALTRIEIVTSDPGPFASNLFWIFHSMGAPPLVIPGDAAGAERIHDALIALPGMDFRRVAQAAGAVAPGASVVWRRPGSLRRVS